MVYVGIILSFEDKFLIQLRDNDPKIANPGLWGLFGGSSEGSENPREAITREMLEELGFKLEKSRLREFYNDEVNFIFSYELTKEEDGCLLLNEGQKIGRFTLNEILNIKEITEGTRTIFLELSRIKQ